MKSILALALALVAGNAAAMTPSVEPTDVNVKPNTVRVATTNAIASADSPLAPRKAYNQAHDFNTDNAVDFLDVQLLVDYIVGKNVESITEATADINEDGKVSVADVTKLIDSLIEKINVGGNSGIVIGNDDEAPDNADVKRRTIQ